MTLIDGKKIAAEIRAEIAAGAAAFRERTGRAPGLAVVLAGENPASVSYVTAKERACAEAGKECVVIAELNRALLLKLRKDFPVLP